MKSCVSCKTLYQKGSGITFHRFPKDCTREMWLNNMKANSQWLPKQSDLLCSKHFEADCFNINGNRTTVKRGSIPTIFTGNSPASSQKLKNDLNMNFLVTEFCRTCLAFDGVQLCPLLDSPLKKTLNYLLGIEIKKDDVSSFICCGCKALLLKYHRFRAKSLRAQKLLRVLANTRGEVESIKGNYLHKIRVESSLNFGLVEDHLVTGTNLIICSHQDHQLPLPPVADNHCNIPASATREPSNEDCMIETEVLLPVTEDSPPATDILLPATEVLLPATEVLLSEKAKNGGLGNVSLQLRKPLERNVIFEPLKVQPRASTPRSYLPSRKSVSLVAKTRTAKTSEASTTRTDSVSQELQNQITRLIETDGKWDGTRQCEVVKLDEEELVPLVENLVAAPEPDIRSQLLESAFATEMILSPEEQLQEMEERRQMKSYLRARFKCALCLTGFQRDEKYRFHMETVHDESLGEFVCEMCHYRFNRSFKLNNHLASAHLKRYQCLRCPQRSRTQHIARLHGLWHTRENYPCKICHRIFDTIRAVQRHIYTVHERDSIARSRVSSVNYPDGRGGWGHTKLRPSPHPCPRCAAVLTGPRALHAHLRAAHNETRKETEGRIYMCEMCGHGCATLGSLRSHHLRHTHAKPHKCQQCSNSYPTAWKLRQHERGHSGDRPFPCSVCGKRFVSKTHLNRHLRIHTGLKPYVCMYCGRAFNQSTAMRDHIKMVHFKMRRRRAPKKKTKKEEAVIHEQNVDIDQSVASEQNAEMELNVEYEQDVEDQSVEYLEDIEYLENDENVETEIVYSYNSAYVLNSI